MLIPWVENKVRKPFLYILRGYAARAFSVLTFCLWTMVVFSAIYTLYRRLFGGKNVYHISTPINIFLNSELEIL